MAANDLELYYERKLLLTLNVLDELDRLEIDPDTTEEERGNIKGMKPTWQREYALVRAQYAGIRSAQSTLPLPPQSMREKISQLCDEVERQININKAAEAGIATATKFVGMLNQLKALA